MSGVLLDRFYVVPRHNGTDYISVSQIVEAVRVDTRTEVQIQQAMRRLMRDKTCFVVAHRLSTIKNADLILVVRGGNVVESGTHRELMAKGGFYREMYDAQFH